MSKLVRYLLLVGLLSVVFWGAADIHSRVSALNECDLELIYLDAEDFQPCQEIVDTSCGGSFTLTGSNNEEKVYNFLVGKGLSPKQAAGVMGNLAVESGFVPNNQQNGSPWPTDGWGLAQWTGSRRTTLANAVKKADLPYVADKPDGGRDLTAKENDDLLAFQLEFMFKESSERDSLTSPGKKEWDGLKQVDSVRAATVYWLENFERAGIPHLDDRMKEANRILTKYGSSGGGDSSSGGVGSCESGELVGGFSLPVDKKWYKSNPEWFTKPHHNSDIGIDIPVPKGTPVYAVAGGTIIKAPIVEGDSSYGQGVWIRAADGTEYIYAHGSDGGSVKGAHKGDVVKAGQLIMHSASTGNSTGPHLHFEILRKGDSATAGVCPGPLLKAIGDGKSTVPAINSLPRSGCTS